MSSFISRLSGKFQILMASIALLTFFSVPAFATSTVADMWTAVDLSTISSNVITLLIAIIGIKLVFVTFGYIRSSLSKARG